MSWEPSTLCVLRALCGSHRGEAGLAHQDPAWVLGGGRTPSCQCPGSGIGRVGGIHHREHGGRGGSPRDFRRSMSCALRSRFVVGGWKGTPSCRCPGAWDRERREGITAENTEVTEALRMISVAPRFGRWDQELFCWGGGGRAPIMPMPATRDEEGVVGAVNPLCPPCSLWFTPGRGGACAPGPGLGLRGEGPHPANAQGPGSGGWEGFNHREHGGHGGSPCDFRRSTLWALGSGAFLLGGGGGRAPILPMPATRDREPVVGAVSPLCPPCSPWFTPGRGGACAPGPATPCVLRRARE